MPAWAVAVGYKHRWDIEKIFDQFKNKMMKTKSWATGSTVKESHAVFQCLAHNLSLVFEEEIKKREGLEDRCESRTAEGRRETRTNREGQPMQAAANFINRVFQRATQRTVRFPRFEGLTLPKGSLAASQSPPRPRLEVSRVVLYTDHWS